MTCAATDVDERERWSWQAPVRGRKRIECYVMHLLAFALTMSLADFAVASAQTATPDTENGRYSFNPVPDGVLRLDTRTGQVSQCNRSDAGWACKVVPDELGAGERDWPPAGRERDAKEAAFGPWAADTRCAWSTRRKARRAGAQAAERCRGRQGDFVP
jgi:hypothetical protein